MAELKYLCNINLNGNQLQNSAMQILSSDPSGFEGHLYYNSSSNVLKFHNGTEYVSLSSASGDITGVTAGDGLTGGGSSGGVTLNVVGGDGITANANDVAITAAQTTITSVLNASLAIGRDAHNQIDFSTDNQIKFKTNNETPVIIMKASGEIEATKFDGALEGNADTATALATARNIGGVSFDGTSNINLPGVNTAGNQNTSGTAAVATTVTITDNESTDEDNPIVFVAGGDTDGGNLGLETDGNAHYNPSTGKITATAFAGALTGDVTGNADTATALATGRNLALTGDVTATLSSFDGSGNVSAAATIASAAVHHGMLNDDIISGQGALTSGLASTDELMISDAGTVKRMDVSVLQSFLQSNLTFTTNTDADVSIANLKTKLAGGFGSNAVTIGDSNDVVTIGNDLIVTGDLTVSGDTVTVNTATLDVEDKNITVNKGSGDTSSTADGAGLTIQDAVNSDTDATMLWNASSDKFVFSHLIEAPGTSIFTNLDISGDVDVDGTLETDALSIGSTTVSSTAAELNLVDGSSAGTIVNSKAVIYGSSGEVNATTLQIGGTSITSTAAELNILDGVTATASELNIMDGVTATTAEINLIDGGTSRGTTAVADGDGFLHNDGGTMRMTNVSKLADLLAGTNITASSSVLSVANASTSAKGVVELATTAESLAGSSSSLAVTPAGLAARSFKATIGDGSDQDIAITHSLGTRDVIVQCYDASSYETIIAEVVRTDANTVTINTNGGSSIIDSNDLIVLITKID